MRLPPITPLVRKRILLSLAALIVFGLALIAGAWGRACAGGA